MRPVRPQGNTDFKIKHCEATTNIEPSQQEISMLSHENNLVSYDPKSIYIYICVCVCVFDSLQLFLVASYNFSLLGLILLFFKPNMVNILKNLLKRIFRISPTCVFLFFLKYLLHQDINTLYFIN